MSFYITLIRKLLESIEVIPKFILLLSQNRQLPLQGNGTQSRHYLYVSDAANAVNTILHRGSFSTDLPTIYNISSLDEISINSLVSKLMTVAKIPTGIIACAVQSAKDRPYQDARYGVTGDKIATLGWKQKVRIEEGLDRTVHWYLKHGRTWWGDVDRVLGDTPMLEMSN